MLIWGHNCLFFVFFLRRINVSSREKTLLLAELQLDWGCHLGRGIDCRLRNWRWSLWWCWCVEQLSLRRLSCDSASLSVEDSSKASWLTLILIGWSYGLLFDASHAAQSIPIIMHLAAHCSEAAVHPMQSSWIPLFLPSCLCQYRELWAE